jgi:hypothetical protein
VFWLLTSLSDSWWRIDWGDTKRNDDEHGVDAV